uniref:Ecto-NOX disulfide-thiol exchanger 1/2 domain-containing protein n=1 Tax=Phlebotomus papatasi TaxID=29031 RepID=A0A1B0D578_PHLPP
LTPLNYNCILYSLSSPSVTQIKKVFNAASHKKVWDHFTKAQRKNIDLWKRQALEVTASPLEGFHDEDEMEMSDEERESSLKGASKRAKLDNENLKASLENSKNDSLRCQLEVYKNEVDLVKSDLKSDTDIKDQQIKVLQETIRNMQTQLLENKSREKEKESKIVDLEAKLKAANVKELLLKTKIATKSSSGTTKTSSAESEDNENPEEVPEAKSVKIETSVELLKPIKIEPDEAKIIGLVSTFLVVHPFGASTDYIWSYVHRVAPHLRPKALEEILSRYKSIFVEEVTGIGAKIERNWRFCGFDE